MLKLLEKPYPLLESRAARWRMSILFSVFVFLFLSVFKPFGLHEAGMNLYLLTAGYGLVCLVIMVLLNIVLVPLLPGLFRESAWTTGHQIFWTLVNVALIGLGNAVFTMWVFDGVIELHGLLRFELYTLSIGLFPVAVSALLNQFRLERQYSRASLRLNEQLHPETRQPVPDEATLTLHSDNQGEDLHISAHQLLYFQAADNYVEVVYQQGNQLQKTLLRTTLKRVEAELAGHPQFWRCHKSYLVNKNYVTRFSGNAQGYRLHLQYSDALVPVSRSLYQSLKHQFNI